MDENEHGSRAGPDLSRPGDHEPMLFPGSAVCWDDAGVLILGPSGAGKSGLALRLIAAGASLVSDDWVHLARRGEEVVASPPQALRGLIEARGLGLLRVPFRDKARLLLAVDLAAGPGARMPEPRKIALLGREIRLILGHEVPNLDAIIMVIAQKRADMV